VASLRGGRVISYSATDPTVPLTAKPDRRPARRRRSTASGFGGINDGLYAVVLLHGQQPSGIAEVFPRESGRPLRSPSSRSWDTVEIALVGLPQPIPAGTQFQARCANLPHSSPVARACRRCRSTASRSVSWRSSEDCRHGFDPALLSHPLRAGDDGNAATDDLARHYTQLYGDLTAKPRRTRGDDIPRG